jgi:hypothetical protein
VDINGGFTCGATRVAGVDVASGAIIAVAGSRTNRRAYDPAVSGVGTVLVPEIAGQLGLVTNSAA